MRKTAAVSVAKLHDINGQLVEDQGFLEALEALQRDKISHGLQMRAELERKVARAQRKEREHVKRSHSSVFDVRKKKQKEVNARVNADRLSAIAIGEAAKVARAERKEETKATVRRQEQAAREYTAKVRYETRPEVRQESSAHFQAQRLAIAKEARSNAERERIGIEMRRQAYLVAANLVRTKVEKLHETARVSREQLAETRKQDADKMRADLNREKQRKQQLESYMSTRTQALHNEIRTWREQSRVPKEEAMQSTWGWWVRE